MGWQFWIDRGGTFTDIVALRPDGSFATAKLLSENPDQYDDAALEGIRRLLGLQDDVPLPRNIDAVKIGTTVATNALLERKGAPTLLVCDRGLGDLLAIGHQARPALFDLAIRKPSPLHVAVLEVDGRVDAQGNRVSALDEAAVLAALAQHQKNGLAACAISLIHAWRHPATEARVAALARQAGFTQISAGHAVSPLLGLLSRSQTTVADAYLSPVLRRYVDRLTRDLAGTPLYFMQSSGGLAQSADFQGRDAILSGPAGGLVGASRTAEALGITRIIGFDMGGTSTDVALYAGTLERSFETEIDGLELRRPMMAIHTVAAGGGSILHFESGRLRVGPDSAGANPGPACYRRGGPLTVTDANLLLGKLQPRHFPAIFGPDGDLPLDREVVVQKFAALARDVFTVTGQSRTPEALAEDFITIAVSNMARAARRVSLEKGYDPADFTLQSFGGAGGQHACLVADALGMDRVLIHPLAGVLSAYGMGLADERRFEKQAIELPLDQGWPAAADTLGRLAQMAPPGAQVVRTVDLRYAGTDTALAVPFGPGSDMTAAFEAEHRRVFGFITPDRDLMLESVAVEIVMPGMPEPMPVLAPTPEAPQPIDHVQIWTGGGWHELPVFDRDALGPGAHIEGPALIRETTATTVIEPGWQARVERHGELLLTRIRQVQSLTSIDLARPEPMRLELFNNLFMSVAERMGAVLRNTSTSVNIKERLDFSCALFDAAGNLVANAPHVPVHLGAMGESVRRVLASRRGTLKPGDMIALNNPFNGGTHLPDVTLIAPVFDDNGRELRFFVGNRGHHADIGGITPGSTPPGSTRLEEEGVVIDDFLLVDGGTFREVAFRDMLARAPYPARSPDTNVSDIRAQIAANQAGISEAGTLNLRYGWPMVTAYMEHIMANAEESVRQVIDRLGDGAFSGQLDNGRALRVAVRIDRPGRHAVIDFTGTGAQDDGNFNAPPAVTRAVVLFVFRCLMGTDLPLNEGCLAPLEIVIPPGSFLAPDRGRAVVAGNTEVSQAVANALLAALGSCAASQGTMNNFLFGNDRVQYYETICGGAGAGPSFDGASAVHTHMTNTRITDPEMLETRYPVRLERFAIRRDSGGGGAHPGGDGVVRSIRMLEPVTVSIVSSCRIEGPFGLDGGDAGARGEQYVDRIDGRHEPLSGVTQTDLVAGDVITIATPGGGGFGTAIRR